MAPEFLVASLTPTANGSWAVEAFSLCVFLLLPNLREVPHGMKGTSLEFIRRPVYLRSQFRNNSKDSFTIVLLIRLLHVLCTQYEGVTHHRVLQTSGQGWADSKAVHGIECSGGTLALLGISHSRGCYLQCTALPVQEGVITETTGYQKNNHRTTTTPSPVPWWYL